MYLTPSPSKKTEKFAFLIILEINSSPSRLARRSDIRRSDEEIRVSIHLRPRRLYTIAPLSYRWKLHWRSDIWLNLSWIAWSWMQQRCILRKVSRSLLIRRWRHKRTIREIHRWHGHVREHWITLHSRHITLRIYRFVPKFWLITLRKSG